MVVAEFGVELDATVTQAEVESVARASLATQLESSDSAITVDDVYEVTERRRLGAEKKLTSDSTLWHVDYRVEVEGTDNEDTQSALAALETGTTGTSEFSLTIQATLFEQGINSSVYVDYVGDPKVELWMHTTATLTSTSSTTCCVCPWPDVHPVPIGVAGPDFQVAGPLPGLLRIECTGFKWGDTCTPVCAPGYHVEETLLCSGVTENGSVLIDGEWQGTARCEPNVCVGGPPLDMPVGYDGVDEGCFDRNYTQTCNVSCSVDDGYENLGGPVLIECTATAAYAWVSTAGLCAEKACYADTVPFIANVVDSSSCIDVASGASCSPVCDSSYELVAPINCTRGAFDVAPVVCVPAADAEALDSAAGLVVEAALVESSQDAGLTAEWAAGSEQWAAIKGAFGAVLGLSKDQIHVYTVKGLNSDYQSGLPARRLTTSRGLWMQLLFQMYPADNETTLTDGLASLNAGGGNLTSELAAALRDAGVAVPQGLAAATLVVGAPVSTIVTVPVARWVARDDWSLCSNLCGVGEQTRTVDCLTGFEDLCNANAPPAYTKESFMPDTRVCETYISCPYDWTCPSGPDPVTGEGCDAQASFVVGASIVSFFMLSYFTIEYVRKMSARPTRGTVGVRLGRYGEKVDITWTRDDGFHKDGQQKSRLRYDLGPDEMAQFYEDPERAPGRATLLPLGEAEDPIGPVDLNFSGAVDFEIQLKVRTFAMNSLVVGKIFPRGETPYSTGKPKALLIKHGIPAWQIGDECVVGKTNVADGCQHVLSVKYNASEDAYILKVDGMVEAVWHGAVADNPDTKLVLGTSCAPRDDTFNELYPDFEDLLSAGIEVLTLEERGDEPLFDGDVDGLTWKEYRWSKDLGMMAWFAYDLRIETEDALGTAMSRQATARLPPAPSADRRSAGSAPHLAFQKGQNVEYWSKTIRTWLPARIVDSKRVYFDGDLEIGMARYEIYVASAAKAVPDAEMKDLRLPLSEGESVSVFSQKHGKWFPASIDRSMMELDPRLGYGVRLEDELAVDGETRVKTELQRDLEAYTRDKKAREMVSRGHITPRRGSQSGEGGTMPEQRAEQSSLPALKNMPSKRLRRRYTRGDLVSVYKGVDVGFVEAEVVREMDLAEQGPTGAEAEHTAQEDEVAFSPPRHRTSPTLELDRELDRVLAGMPADRGAQRLYGCLREAGPRGAREASGSRRSSKASRRSISSDHRHAMVVVRLVGGSQESPRADGGEGAASMPGDNEIRVSEFLLRRRGRDRQEGGPPSLLARVWSLLRGEAPPPSPFDV